MNAVRLHRSPIRVGKDKGVHLNRQARRRRSPAAIFGPALAYWYDDQDLSTMFADFAGTPATVGSAVALQLDKSRGGALGSDIKSSGAIGLVGTATAATYNTSTGVGTVSTVDASNYSRVTFSGATVGRPYFVDIENTGAVSLDVRDGSTMGTVAAGQRKTVFVRAIASTLFVVAPTNGTTASFTVHSVKEVLGTPRYQTTAAQRPILGRHPKGGRRNIITDTEAISSWSVDAGGGAASPTLTANYGTAPDGTMTADRVQLDKTGGTFSRVQKTLPVSVSSAVHTASVWMRTISGTANVGLRNDINGVNCALTTTWQRFEIANGAATVNPSVQVLLFDSIAGNDETADILVWGAQLETGSTATAYQKVTTTYDCTETGVPDCYYLQADGSDDGMVTPALDLTATDKIGVFTAVRKLSDATLGIVAEQGPTGGVNSFTMAAPRANTSANFGFISQGSAAANATSANSFAAPYTSILTGLGDISGDSAILRVNGSQAASDTTDQGTGNFGNYALYFFRRGGSSLPFNGLEYGSFACIGLPNADQIAAVDAYQNNIVGAY